MGNTPGRCDREAADRRRISANSEITQERQGNERKRQSNRHRREMQENQVESDRARAEQDQIHRERMDEKDSERRRIRGRTPNPSVEENENAKQAQSENGAVKGDEKTNQVSAANRTGQD